MLADFQICVSVPLRNALAKSLTSACEKIVFNKFKVYSLQMQ